jgi:hypothetical protein
MQVQATDIDLAAAASTRSGSTNATEKIMTFTAKANANKDAKVRQGLLYPVNDNTSWTNSGMAADAADTTTYVSGNGTTTGSVALTEDGASATTDYSYYDTGSTTALGAYSRVSFWIQSDTAKAAGDLEFITDTETDLNNSSANEGNLSVPALTAGEWKFVDGAITNNAAAQYLGINIAANPDNSAVINLDEITFYNDKLNVDLKLNENWAAVTPTVAYLVQDGSAVASAYVDFDGAVGNRTGQIQFVPTGTYPDVEISSVTSTFTVEMDTATAITDDATATEKLTATMDLGNVTLAGDVYWYDGAGTVNFLGVNSTDNISTTSNY